MDATNMIDLTAFDLDADDLAGLLSVRGEGDNARVVIDLRDVGGGTIELAGVRPILMTFLDNRPRYADGNVDDRGVFII